MPGSSCDFIGFEVGVQPTEMPVAMHVRVRPEACADVQDIPELGTLAASPQIRESGFVVEAHDGHAVPAAVYAGVRDAFRQDAESMGEVCALLGVGSPETMLLQDLCGIWPVAYVGVMTARRARPVRAVLTVPRSPEAWQRLASHTGLNLAEPQEWASTWDGTVFVNLDLVGGRFGPTVGIELKASQGEDLYGWCAKYGLHVRALSAWEGTSLFNEREKPFDAADLAQLYRGGEAVVTQRRLNHVKVTCGPTTRTFKAYLSASRIAARRMPPE